MPSSLALQVSNLLNQRTFKQLHLLHALIIKTSLDRIPEIRLKFLRRSTEFGGMEYSNLIFKLMGGFYNTEVTLWNAMMRGYAYNGPFRKCISMFDEMTLRNLKPNNFTYPYVLNSCSHLGLFSKGQRVHCQIIKSGFESASSVGSGLFDFYVKRIDSLHMDLGKNGSLDDARMIFDCMCEKTIELWNRMIGKYVSIRELAIVRELFDKMPERDVISWNTMISGYVKAGEVANAIDLFEQMPEKNLVSWTIIVGAYADVGDLKTARIFFEKMPDRNVVSWNCMMSGYIRRGEFQEALNLFLQMQLEGLEPDTFSFVSALSACSNLSDLQYGKWVHYLIRDWPNLGVIVGTALVDMYARCGDINRAFTIFIKIGNKDVFCYNVMIKSLAIHGRAKDAIIIFHLMQKRGLKPNDFTFSCVLFACSHGGLVEEGHKIFHSMGRHLKLNPKIEHYCVMIDMLSRNDCLEEGLLLINEMPVEPDIATWGALLGGCRERGNLELAESILKKVIELKPKEPGVHVLLSNIHAWMGQWLEAFRAREVMEENRIWKRTGSSIIQ
ncbi:Pentatricopeptide repeat-containing protein [Abeliophyllum distichum]|uniref:Pentatricopeptide repeat-containing protein n=1 Tax=Abeliophyllum distichum TaxID=126358 RepID=A0ABD1QKQ7_9LAMI